MLKRKGNTQIPMPVSFSVPLDGHTDRLDSAWFNPVTKKQIENLHKTAGKRRKMVKLSCVADVTGGKRLPAGTVIIDDADSIIPYVRGQDVKNRKVNIATAAKITKDLYQVVKNYQLQKNDIAITIAGTIGEVGILEEDVQVCNFNENIARIRITCDSVLPEFILYFLESEFGKMQAKRFAAGSIQYKLSLGYCRDIEIPIPHDGHGFDIKEQKRIINEIQAFTQKAETKKQKGLSLVDEANLVVAKKLNIPIPRQPKNASFECSIGHNSTDRIDALFNHPYRHNLLETLRKRPHRSLEKIVNFPKQGNLASRDFYRLVELQQVDGKTGRIIGCQEVPELGSKKVILYKNNIVISKLQPENAKIAIITSEYDSVVASSELIPITLNTDDISLDYLWAVLRSDYILKQWEYALTGSSRMRIGATELKQTLIPYVDHKIQSEIVKEIHLLINENDKILKEANILLDKGQKHFLEFLSTKE